jgi:hypothetical protein
MPNAASLDRAAADFRFRANLLAKLVLDEERKAERETRRLMGAPSGR